MRAFSKVIYGIIDVELRSALHIGTGGDDKSSDIARNDEGQYIIPATAIAGVSLHHIQNLRDNQETADQKADVDSALELMGNPRRASEDGHKVSRVYFYDAICEKVQIEQRTGVGMDHVRGTARNGRLFRNLFLSPGMKASIRLQIFVANDAEVRTAGWIIKQIAQGYHTGKIAMGIRTSSGAGRFSVTGVRVLALDLTQGEHLKWYLEGVENCYERAKDAGEQIDIADLSQEAVDGIDSYVLSAYCPEGLIIRSGERDPRNRNEMVDNVAVNMFYTEAQELAQELKLHYYIPGTSIKGVLRTYAERVYSVLGLDEAELDYLFGPGPDSKNRKRKSCIHTFDVDLSNVTAKRRSRIKVDRWLGSVMDGALMEEELLYTDENQAFDLQIMADYNLLEDLTDAKDAPDPKVLKQHARAVLFLAMRDLGTGRVTLGAGSSVGHGRLQGKALTFDQAEFQIDGDQIDCGENKDKIQRLLQSLRKGDNDARD